MHLNVCMTKIGAFIGPFVLLKWTEIELLSSTLGLTVFDLVVRVTIFFVLK